eukprot:4622789-Prymnesium_polylepis.1
MTPPHAAPLEGVREVPERRHELVDAVGQHGQHKRSAIRRAALWRDPKRVWRRHHVGASGDAEDLDERPLDPGERALKVGREFGVSARVAAASKHLDGPKRRVRLQRAVRLL